MRNRLTPLLLAIAVSALTLAPAASGAQGRVVNDPDYAERDEINESYDLAPGAEVSLSVVSGSVTVETTAGSKAEVHIVRSAATREMLDCYRIAITHTADRLVMRHQQESTPECNSIRARQRVLLRLPRNVNLRLNAISGPVKIAEMEGRVELSGISGRVEVAQGTGYSNISGISGVLVVSVGRLGERGLDVSGISGRVELLLAPGLNADLDVSGINGGVNADPPRVVLSKTGVSSYRGRVGSGGTPISVSGISGTVSFRGE